MASVNCSNYTPFAASVDGSTSMTSAGSWRPKRPGSAGNNLGSMPKSLASSNHHSRFSILNSQFFARHGQKSLVWRKWWLMAERPIISLNKILPKVWMHAGDELYARLRGPGKNMTVLATAYSAPDKRGTG